MVILLKEKRLYRKNKVLPVSQQLTKIVQFREFFYFTGNIKCCICWLSENWYILLLIPNLQLTAVEQSLLWNKSSFKNKTELCTTGKKKTLFYSNWIGLAKEIIFLSLLRISFNSCDVLALHLSWTLLIITEDAHFFISKVYVSLYM